MQESRLIMYDGGDRSTKTCAWARIVQCRLAEHAHYFIYFLFFSFPFILFMIQNHILQGLRT